MPRNSIPSVVTDTYGLMTGGGRKASSLLYRTGVFCASFVGSPVIKKYFHRIIPLPLLKPGGIIHHLSRILPRCEVYPTPPEVITSYLHIWLWA